MATYDYQAIQRATESWYTDHTINLVSPKENNITMIAGGTEMLRVAEDGFYVRGKKVPVDDKEAETVYNAFKQFLVWAELNRN